MTELGIVFMIGVFCAISICCAASRATWSFARDKAIPYSAFFGKVNHGFLEGVPLSAYLLSTTVQILLGLIFLGSSTAFNAFVGVAVMCLGVSYALPVLLSVLNGRSEVLDAPYSLGRWGYLINCIAVLWVFFEMVLFSMPAVIPVTSTSMSEWGIKDIDCCLVFNERFLIWIEQIMHLLCLLDSLALVGHGTLWVSITIVLELRNAHEMSCSDGRRHYSGPPIPE